MNYKEEFEDAENLLRTGRYWIKETKREKTGAYRMFVKNTKTGEINDWDIDEKGYETAVKIIEELKELHDVDGGIKERFIPCIEKAGRELSATRAFGWCD